MEASCQDQRSNQKACSSGYEVQRKTSAVIRDPQEHDSVGIPQGIVTALRNKVLPEKLKSGPSATAICEKMNNIREAGLSKMTTEDALRLMNLTKGHRIHSTEKNVTERNVQPDQKPGTYTYRTKVVSTAQSSCLYNFNPIEKLPPPPLEVSSVLYGSNYGNLMKVYWKPPVKNYLLDGYKVLTSDDGKVWTVRRVLDRRKICAFGLKPKNKIGVCTYRGDQDSKIVMGRSALRKRLTANSSESFKTSSYIFARKGKGNDFFGGAGQREFMKIHSCNVRIAPLQFHRIMCTPLKLTPLAEEEDGKSNFEDRSVNSILTVDVASTQRVKYCFSLEKKLVGMILNSKDPAFNSFGIQVLVRFCLFDESCVQQDEIPDCIVRVNRQIACLQVKDKHCRPVDITHLCNFTEGKCSEDILSIEWMPSRKKKYCVTICVVERLSVSGIVSDLMMKHVKDRSTTEEMVENKFKFDKDVSCTSLKATLICPLGKTRIVSPCRGSNCTHIQCMDALTLLQMNEDRPLSRKKCYMCDEPIGDIYIDGLFLDILSSVPDSVNEIEFKQNGTWSYVKNNSEYTAQTPLSLSNKKHTDLQCVTETRIRETSADNEPEEEEEDILNEMKTHLSKLKSQIDQIEYLTKQHELFKEKVQLGDGVTTNESVIDLSDDETPNLVDLTSDNEPSSNDIEKERNTGIDGGVVANEHGYSIVTDLSGDKVPEYLDLTSDNEEEVLEPTCDILCVKELLDIKTNIDLGIQKEKVRNVETERKIENMIAKMLKNVKKVKDKNVREKEDEIDEVCFVSEEKNINILACGKNEIPQEVKARASTESDISPAVFEHDQDADDEDDIVEIDLNTGSLKEVESNTSFIKAYKEDGTLASDAELSFPGSFCSRSLVEPIGMKAVENPNNNNSHSKYTGENKNIHVDNKSLSENLDKPLYVPSSNRIIALDVNNELQPERLKKCENESSQKEIDKAIEKQSVECTQTKHEQNVKVVYNTIGTRAKAGIDNGGQTAVVKRKLQKESTSQCGNQHSLADKNSQIFKVDGTLDDWQYLKPLVAAQKESEMDLNLKDPVISLKLQEKTNTGMCGKQINLKYDNVNKRQGISPVAKNTGLMHEQKIAVVERSPNKNRRGSSGTELEVNPHLIDLRTVCIETGRKTSTAKSDDMIPYNKRKRGRRPKLQVDDRTKLPNAHFEHQVLLSGKGLKRKGVDFAPPTKKLMKIADTGKKRKLEKFPGPNLEDVLRNPGIPLRSKRLQSFCEKNLGSGNQKADEIVDHQVDNPRSASNAEEPNLRNIKVSKKKRKADEGQCFLTQAVEAQGNSETVLGKSSRSRMKIVETEVEAVKTNRSEGTSINVDKCKKNDLTDSMSTGYKLVSAYTGFIISLTAGKSIKGKGEQCISRADIANTVGQSEMDTEQCRMSGKEFEEIFDKNKIKTEVNTEDDLENTIYTNASCFVTDTSYPSTSEQEDLSSESEGRSYIVHRDKVLNPEIGKIPGEQEVDFKLEDETVLLNIVKYMLEHGFPMSVVKIGTYARQINHKLGYKTQGNFRVVNSWVEKFFARHPELGKLQSKIIPERAESNWMANLEKMLTKYDLKDRPERIFNFEKFGWPCVNLTKAEGDREDKHSTQKTAAVRHVNAGLCVCADGRFLPTTVVFQGLLPSMKDLRDFPPSMCYATSDYGQMNSQIFLEWFNTCFLPNCGEARPVCLLLKSQNNLLTLPVVETAIDNDVVLIGIPENAEHILQTLDAKVITHLKSSIDSRCRDLYSDCAMTTARFPALLQYALEQRTLSHVKEAFKATGICPFSQSAFEVDEPVLTPSEVDKPVLTPSEVDTVQGKSRYRKSPKRESGRLRNSVPATEETIKNATVRMAARKQEDIVMEAAKTARTFWKRKFPDVNLNPTVCLKWKKRCNVNGHNIYV